jgi:hypothetical protein
MLYSITGVNNKSFWSIIKIVAVIIKEADFWVMGKLYNLLNGHKENNF